MDTGVPRPIQDSIRPSRPPTMSSPASVLRSVQPHLRTVCLCSVLYLLGLLGLSVWVLVGGLGAYLSYLLLNQPNLASPQGGELAESDDEEGLAEDEFPEWTAQPGLERAEWINNIIAKIWPNIEKVVRDKIVESLAGEQVTSYLNRMGGGEVTVKSFDIGDIPPRLQGVKIQGVSSDELILDSQIIYNGTSNVCLSLTLSKFPQPVPLSIENFTMSGKLRIICKPLLNEKPFVGGVRLSFLDTPDFDFEPGGLLAVTDLPGLRSLVRSQVTECVDRSLVFPRGVQLTVPADGTSPPVNQQTNLNIPRGVLSFSLVEARELKSRDFSVSGRDVSDPYARISFAVDGREHTFETEVKKNSLDPVWNFQEILFVDSPDTMSDITVNIFDKDEYSKDDFLGECVVYKEILTKVVNMGKTYDYWKILEKTAQGSVRVRVSWSRLDANPPKNTDDQALVVTYLDSGRNVLGEDRRKPDTKIKLTVGDQHCCSKTIYQCKTPIFEERLLLLSNNPTNDDIQIELIDDVSGSVLGSSSIELTQVLSQEDRLLSDLDIILNSATDVKTKLRLSVALRFLHPELPVINQQSQSLQTVEHEDIFPVNSISGESVPGSGSPLDSPRGPVKDGNGISNGSFLQDQSEKNTPKHVPTSFSERNVSSGEKSNGVETQPFRRYNTLPLQKVDGRYQSYRRGRRPTRTETKAKILLTLKYNRTTSVLSLVIHKAINLQVSQHHPDLLDLV